MPDQTSSKKQIMAGSSQKSSTINAGGSTALSSEQRTSQKSQSQKIMITGDDILIEYVARLVKTMSQSQAEVI